MVGLISPVQDHLLKSLHFAAVGFCVWIAWVIDPPILGLWEASSFFHAFAPEELWLNTAIHPRANIGGYEYALIDISRTVATTLGATLRTLRLMPILYGLGSLVLVYLILRRYSRPALAVSGVALLASNPMFLMFQHQLLK